MANEFARNLAVISMSDLDRIKRTCVGITMEEEEFYRKKDEKASLREKSQNKIKNWGNGIEALREKKELDRYQKFEAEELQRRKIDEQEESIQQEKKRQAIEKANKMLHDSSDQVKAFHSKMFLSDILQEREMQIEINKKKEDFQKEVEEVFVKEEAERLKEYDKVFIKKLENQLKQKIENKKTLKGQIHENKKKAVKRLQEDYIEGQLMKKKTQQDIEADKKAELAKRQRAIDGQNEAKRANDILQQMKIDDYNKQLEEEKRIQEYAENKERIMATRKAREEKRFKDKLDTRQKMIDNRTQELKNFKSNEDKRLLDQITDAELKAQEKFLEKQNKLEDLKYQIDKSRKQQIGRKTQEKISEKEEEEAFAGFWKEKMKELSDIETAEIDEKKERAKQLQNFHKKQMDFKMRKAEQEALIEEELARQSLKIQDDEHLQFHSYAEKCLQEWSAQGKNITPLILELKNYKKRTV